MSRTLIVPVVLVLLAPIQTPAARSEPVVFDLLPRRATTILAVEVVKVTLQPWQMTAHGAQSRTVDVTWRIPEVIKHLSPTTVTTMQSPVQQNRWGSGIIGDDPNPWSAYELKAGQAYLVFAEGAAEDSLAHILAHPSSVVAVDENSSEIQDVTHIVNSEKLDAQAQAGALRRYLGGGNEKSQHGVFLGQYLSSLAFANQGPARGELLSSVADIDNLAFTEQAKAELLRTFHIGLLMEEVPSVDAIEAFSAAVLKSFATADIRSDQSLRPRIESAASVYLPWLLKRSGGLDALRINRYVSAEERAQAARILMVLGKRTQFDPEVRGLLSETGANLGQAAGKP